MSGIRRVSDLGTKGWSNILDGSIVTADLANSAVTTAKIADNNITQAKLDTAIPLSGMRNAIINGSFDIWQRLFGTSLTFSATANLTNYNAADRWFFGQNPTAGSLTISQTASDNSQFLYGLRFGRADGQTGTSNGQVYLGQALETSVSRRFAGQTATLSFWVKRNTAGGATPPTSLNVKVYAGQGTDQSSFTWMTTGWTGQSTVLDQSITTTGTMTRYSYSFSVPSTTKQLLLHFFYTPTTSPASGEWFQIEGVQLEVGAQATPFEQRPIGVELALCQRYYILLASGAEKDVSNITYYNSTTAAGVIHLPVQMRTTPTFAGTTGTNYYNVYSNNNGGDGINSITIQVSSPAIVSWYNNTEASGTGGYSGSLRTANASAVVAVQAEL